MTPPALPKSRRPRAPRLEGRTLNETLPDDMLHEAESYDSLHLEQTDLAGIDVADCAVIDTVCERVILRDSRLARARWRDVRFLACDLANADWYKTSVRRVEFLGCRMTGFKAPEGGFEDTTFHECQARLAQFRFATFKTVRFESCDLADADFQGADLSGVVFAGCDLSRAELSGARLVGADLRGAQIEGLRVGPPELRGAIVDPLQALELVRLLGVIIAPQE